MAIVGALEINKKMSGQLKGKEESGIRTVVTVGGGQTIIFWEYIATNLRGYLVVSVTVPSSSVNVLGW